MKYYKILNERENHNGFQYRDGLNELAQGGANCEFDEDPGHSCAPGGLYFTDAGHVLDFLTMGDHVREVLLPGGAKLVKDGDNKYRADKIILGSRIEFTDDWVLGLANTDKKKQTRAIRCCVRIDPN